MLHYTVIYIHDFGDAAPVLTIIQGTGSDLYLFLLFEGIVGGRFVPPLNKRMTQIAASAGGYIRIARQCRFLVIIIVIIFIIGLLVLSAGLATATQLSPIPPPRRMKKKKGEKKSRNLKNILSNTAK